MTTSDSASRSGDAAAAHGDTVRPDSRRRAVNADAGELAKFDAIADRWWDTDGEFEPLHQINPLRLDWLEKQAAGLDGKRVLDIGCGGGILSEAMARAGARVTGIDLAAASIDVARQHAETQGLEIDYRVIAAEAFAEEETARFDVVTCLELLEHVPDPASVVQAAGRLVKPGGRVFLSTLNRNPKSWLFAIVGAERVLGLLPRGTHDWQHFIKPAELARYCRRAGLTLDAMIGLHYNPFDGSYSLGEGVDVNYLVATTRNSSDDWREDPSDAGGRPDHT